MDDQIKNRLFLLGRPFGPFYGSAMKVRAYLFKRHVFKHYRLNVPVISVGNLTMGGTGKTPFIIYLARLLQERGFRPAVVSRGYRGKSNTAFNIVSDGEQIMMSPDEAGDEPVLMAQKLPSMVIATGKKRHLPALEAVEKYHADLILLDDGFQHLRLFRDIDLVLFDIDHFAGNSRVFPGGELREPVSALNRCDAFVLTGRSEINTARTAKIEALLMEKFPDKEVFSLSRTFSRIYRYEINGTSIQKTEIECEQIPPNLFAFSGIANPFRFYDMLESYGCTVSATRDFGDHHAYRQQDIEAICREAGRNNCTALVTTEKDFVKFDPSQTFSLPVFVPVLDYEFRADLLSFITDRIEQKKNINR